MPKKLIAIALVLAASFMIAAPNAKALTSEELQAQINALLAQIALLQAQLGQTGGGTGVTGCTITSFTKNLSQGATGDDVKCLQIILNSSADTQVAASGSGAPGSETTYFGALTKAAVVKFQQKYASEILTPIGLTSGTGLVGSATRAKLNTMITTGGTGGTGGVPVGTGFNVTLAADTPAAGTIVADSTTNDGGQAYIPALKVTFTNGQATAQTITQINFKRTGISADADLSNAYLYDGSTKIADYNAFSSGVLTFSNSGGLFTVPSGGSKTITLVFDLTNGTAAGKTIKFSIDSASNITPTPGGTFPIAGSVFTTAQASDLGKLTIATSTSAGATIDPQENLEVYNFTLAAADQKIQIKKLIFTNIGSTDAADLKNFKLYDGGTQLLSTIVDMASDKTLTFDFSGSPLLIDKGVTKNMHLKADITGGTGRTFQFAIRNISDILAYDTEYGIYVKPNQGTWVVKSVPASTINTGKLVISRASDSTLGNVPLGGTNVTIAKFDLKALGEDVKITSLILDVYGTVGTNGLYQGKIYYDGSQKGTTANLNTGAVVSGNGSTTFSFGNTFVLTKGETKTLSVVTDVKKSAATAYSGGETLTVKVSSITAEGRSSLQTVSSVSAAANQLTISSGSLSAARNASLPDYSASVPTGVPGATDVIVGAFTITAGASEGADITAIKVIDDGTLGFGNLQNLRLYNGLKGTTNQIGSTQSSVAVNSTYTFYPSPYISLNKSQSMALYVYADLLTATTTADMGYVKLSSVEGTGKTTNNSVAWTTGANGQSLVIVAAGALTNQINADTPLSANVMFNQTGVSFAKYQFTAGAGEDIDITKFNIRPSMGGSAPTGTIANISLWDGSTQVGQTQAAMNYSGPALISFDLASTPWRIAKGATKYLIAKADISAFPVPTSGGNVALSTVITVASTSNDGTIENFTYRGVTSGRTATGSTAMTANAMYTYKSAAKPALNTGFTGGAQPYGAGKDIMWFNVQNLSNDYSVWYQSTTFTINFTKKSTGGLATATAERVFYIVDSVDPSTQLGTTSIASSGTLNGASLSIILTTPKEIGAGVTKTFYLRGDTTDFAAGTAGNATLYAQITDGSQFGWTDTSGGANVATTRTFASPIYGPTITY